MATTYRALRATLGTALGLPGWSIYSVLKRLRTLRVHDASGAATAHDAAIGLLAVIANAPTHTGRGRVTPSGQINETLLRRIHEFANLQPVAHVTEAVGRLPAAFRHLAHPDLPLITALQILLEQSASPHVQRHLVVPAPNGDGFVVPRDAMLFDIHLSGEWPTAFFSLRCNNGTTFKTTFARRTHIAAPSPSSMTMRLGLDSRALVELSRLLAGDTEAETRMAEGDTGQEAVVTTEDISRLEAAMGVSILGEPL
jgi:hypothetical protein